MHHPSQPETRVLRSLRNVLIGVAAAMPLVSCSEEVTGPSDVVGTVWRLESMERTGSARFVPDDPSRFTVEFKADGQLGVRADCNVCGASYTLNDGTLTAGPLVCTLIACPRPEGEQFAAIIDGTSEVDKDDDELEIESSEGKLVLTR
jgi:heat shock protein HslJ